MPWYKLYHSIEGAELALGRVGGYTEHGKFGYVAALDAGDAAADVWAWGSDDVSGTPTKSFPTSASSLYIASDAAGDTDVDITVEYIDANGAAVGFEANLNGTTVVDPSVTGIDVNRAFESGATAAVGNIYITNANAFTAGVPDDPTDVLAFIPAGYGQTEQCAYTVPTGKIMQIKRAIVHTSRASGAAGSADVLLKSQLWGKTWLVKRKWFATTNSPIDEQVCGVVLPERARVVMTVDDVSDLDTNVTGELLFNLVDEVQ